MPIAYGAIPEELRSRNQWCVAAADERTGKYRVPSKITSKGLRRVDPTAPDSWSDFTSTTNFALANPPHGAGYVLSADDPYVCIDLDIKNPSTDPESPHLWTSKEDIDRYHKIVMSFNSYTEQSSGGFGFHIWIRGTVGKGIKRGGVELYSQERFIVCTGNVVLDRPIVENQAMLELLASEMKTVAIPSLKLVKVDEVDSDDALFQRAASAENGEKFKMLCNGMWRELGFPSQSEADESLLTMLAFYSKSNEQCYRMFRMTALGQRPKAHRKPGADGNDYLSLTMIRVRSHQANEAVDTSIGEAMSKALLAQLAQTAPAQPVQSVPATHESPAASGESAATHSSAPENTVPPRKAGNLEFLVKHVYEKKLAAIASEIREPVIKPFAPNSGVEWPPGIIGQVARHIFSTSPRPVKEVSIVAALGLFAGLLGKAYHIPQSGLNLYIVLVARSAIGKEAMHSGIASIVNMIATSVPGITNFIDFNDYASGPALTKAVIANPSMVNVSGEWGKKLQRISNEDRGDGPMQQLRTVMTNLYQKSGPGSIFGGIGYSDKDKNTGSVSGVAYSMIGETTPDTFYDALTESMMADGFLSRFTIVEYTGQRPPLNHNVAEPMDQRLIEYLLGLAKNVIARSSSPEGSILVERDDEAMKMLHDFDLKCDKEINSTDNEGWRQMWNRAHLKVYRIAALLAAADNDSAPTIKPYHVTWAHNLVMSDIMIMSRRLETGNVGTGDSTRENKLLDLSKLYFREPLAASYAIPETLREAGIIPRKYLQINTQRVSAFTNHKLGQIASLDQTIRSLVDGGYFAEVDKATLVQKHTFHGKCYRVLNLPMTTEEARQLKVNQQKQSI
jgi:hypothetical protein